MKSIGLQVGQNLSIFRLLVSSLLRLHSPPPSNVVIKMFGVGLDLGFPLIFSVYFYAFLVFHNRNGFMGGGRQPENNP